MMITASAAIFIREINDGGFSWLHLFVLLNWDAFSAIWNVRRGNIAGHRGAMTGIYVGGLLIAGALTFAPGRVMHRIFLE